MDLTQATLQEWALKNGIDANMQSMSQAEKTMLRYQYVLAQTEFLTGDFKDTQMSWANQTRILAQSFEQLGAVWGDVLIHALKGLVINLNKVMQKIISFSKTIADALGKIFGWTFEVSGGGAGLTDDLEDIDSGISNASDSAKDTASGLSDADKAAKSLKKSLSLLPFDELNQLSSNLGSSSSGSGGSNKGNGATGGAMPDGGTGLQTNLVKTDSIFKAYESSIDTLYHLGEYIGDKLSDAMENINWNRIYEKAKDFGRGLADFLNGTISPRLFGDVGKTVASALNTAIYSALSFGIRFDWKNLGTSIAASLNEFFSTFDFGSLARTINVWANGILDTIITFIDRTDWTMIGTNIGKFLADIDFLEIGLKLGQAVWKAINAGIKVFASSFSQAPIETTLASIIVMPKLLKAIASTRIITAIAGLAAPFKKVFSASKLALTGLAGNQQSVAALTKSFPGLSKVVNLCKESFMGFRVGVLMSGGNIFSGLSAGVQTLQNSMTKLQKGVVGTTAVMAQFALSTSGFHDIAMGSENAAAGIAKIAAGAAIAATALKLMGLSNPFTAIIVGATALVSAIVGINKAMNELLDNHVGDYIKESFSNPGGVPVETLFSTAKDSINAVGDSFDTVRDKINEFENSKESIKSVTVEIDKIRSAMNLGVMGTEEGVQKLTDQYDSLLDAAKLSFDAYETLVYSTFSDGSVATKAYEAAGVNVKELKENVTGFSSETQQKIQELIAKLKDLSATDPTNPQIPELQSQLYNLMGVSDDATKAMDEFETYINSNNIDWSAYINDDGLNVDAINDDLGSLVGSVQDTQEKTKQALTDMANAAKEKGDMQTYQTLMDGLPNAMQYVSDQTTTKAKDIADKLQSDYINKMGDILKQADKDWDSLDPMEKSHYKWSKGNYMRSVLEDYKKNTIDPLDKTVNEQFEKIGVDGEGYASDAAQNIIDSLFTTTTTASQYGGASVATSVSGNYEEVFRQIGENTKAVAGDAGKDTIDGYIEGINSKDAEVEEAAKGPFGKFVDKVKEFLGIHSPSTVFAEIGGFTMEGFLSGLSDNVSGVLDWFGELPGKIKDNLGDAKEWIKSKGSDALEGLRNGWDSVKESKVGQAALNIGQFVKTKAGDANNWIKSKGSDAISGLRSGWDSVKNSNFLNEVGQIGSNVFDRIGNIKNTIYSKGADVISGLKDGFNGNMWSFTNLMAGIPGKITSSIGNLWNVGHNVIQGFANGLSSVSLKLPHIEWTSKTVGIGNFSFAVPKFNINWYKKGGLFDSPSMIGVGEAGKEAVLPLENKRTMNMIAESIINSSGGFGGMSQEDLEAAVERGVAMAMMNNPQSVNVQCVSEFKTNDVALARAVSKGQQKISYRYKPIADF